MTTRLLTVDQVAEMLGVSATFVYQHASGTRRPRIPSVKIGRSVRFRPADIEKFIEEALRAA